MLKPLKIKKKIALCFSGIQYEISNPKDFIFKFLKDYEVYCFIHTWEFEEMLYSHRSSFHNLKPIDFNEIKNMVFYFEIKTEKFTDNFRNFAKIYHKILPERKKVLNNVGPISMFYGIKQSQLIRRVYEIKNNIEFDCVFRCRFENCWRKDINFDINQFNLDYFWLPSTLKYPICDHLAFSNSKNMDYYSCVYDKFIDLANKVDFLPEKILQEHLLNYNIMETDIFGSCGGYLWDK